MWVWGRKEEGEGRNREEEEIGCPESENGREKNEVE